MAWRAVQKIRGFEQGSRYAAEFLRGYGGGPPLTDADDLRHSLSDALAAARARSSSTGGCCVRMRGGSAPTPENEAASRSP